MQCGNDIEKITIAVDLQFFRAEVHVVPGQELGYAHQEGILAAQNVCLHDEVGSDSG